jgi:hypothetical protein
MTTNPVFGRTLPGWRTAAVLALWFATAFAVGAAGWFRADPSRPPLVILIAIAGPPIAFALAYRGSAAFRDFVLSLDLRLLTALQGWRVLGGVFVAFNAYRMLPPLFAYPAGYGDLLVGALAPFALLALADRRPGWQRAVLRLNILGLVDFAGAVGTGLLAGDGPLGLLRGEISTDPLTELPLVLIPGFAVPLWILMHVAALLQLRRPSAPPAMQVTAPAG